MKSWNNRVLQGSFSGPLLFYIYPEMRNGSISGPLFFHIYPGMSQGSIPGPLLFNIFIFRQVENGVTRTTNKVRTRSIVVKIAIVIITSHTAIVCRARSGKEVC